jgi:CRP-like cAMP-binding protein
LLLPHLTLVSLCKGDVLVHAHKPITQVYFPENALGSVVALTREGRRIEVGLFGRDGMSGTSILLGADRSPHETFTQGAGPAFQIAVTRLREVIRQSPSFAALLLRYVEAFNVQVSHTAIANGIYTLEERLARWLLMTHDRMDGNDLPLVQEFLAMMLAVRRAGVSEALQVLEDTGAIKAARGLITIVNRTRLEEIAGGSYGQPEAEYRRLVGAL